MSPKNLQIGDIVSFVLGHIFLMGISHSSMKKFRWNLVSVPRKNESLRLVAEICCGGISLGGTFSDHSCLKMEVVVPRNWQKDKVCPTSVGCMIVKSNNSCRFKGTYS